MSHPQASQRTLLDAAAESVREVLTALLVVFVVLRLTHTVDWSWWAVLAPFWVPAVFAVSWISGMALWAWHADLTWARERS